MRTRSPSCRKVPSGDGNGTTGSHPASGRATGAVNLASRVFWSALRADGCKGWRSTAPPLGRPRESRRQLGAIDRLLRRRFGLGGIRLFVFRQALELIGEQQRMVRRHLELLAARLAGHLVVQPQQVVAQ